MTPNCWLEERNARDRRSSCIGIQAIGGLQDRPDGHAQGGGASEHGSGRELESSRDHCAFRYFARLWSGFRASSMRDGRTVRDGRTNTYVLWDNFYGDMLAVIGLNRGSVNDVPPERPIGSSLSAESYELWVDATNQFQTEGTLPSTSCSPRLTCSSASRSTSTSSGTCGSRCRAPTTARPMPS